VVNWQIAAANLSKRAQARATRADVGTTACWRYQPEGLKGNKILLVHGFRGDHHGLEAIAGALPEFEVFIPDLPGYGKTPALSGAHDLENYASWLIALNQELGCQLVAGHSFGSLLTARAGDKLGAALVLINPVAARSIDSGSLANRLARSYYRLAAGRGSTLLRSQLAVRAMSLALTTAKNPVERAWIHQSHHRYFSNFALDRVAIEGFWAAAGNSTTDFAPEITRRTLVISSARDQISSAAEVAKLHENLRDSELAVISKVGHLLHYERPAEVADLIARFAGDLVRDEIRD
jgi:pimeloyl-ACP methyl ester carboxylesterase